MITKKLLGNYKGQEIYIYTLSDEISADICTLGATILNICTPDKDGNKIDVVLGMLTPEDIAGPKGDYMGAVVGRCGNRIAYGKFTLEGKQYTLDCNNGKAHLHGGFDGFNQRVYDAKVEEDALILTLTSPDGDQGYPGEVTLTVKYTIVGSTLNIEYFGKAKQTTILNVTNHAYFNLNGQADGSILDNVVQIFADSFLAVDENLIPVAQVDVDKTPFDFRNGKTIGQDIGADYEQLAIGSGYDHNFCLNGNHAAHAYSTKTGIAMDVYTDMCGMQFYSGNFLVGNVGKAKYPFRSGFCMETQLWPDAINNPNYKQPILKAGENYYTKTQYIFSVKK